MKAKLPTPKFKVGDHVGIDPHTVNYGYTMHGSHVGQPIPRNKFPHKGVVREVLLPSKRSVRASRGDVGYKVACDAGGEGLYVFLWESQIMQLPIVDLLAGLS